MVIPSFSRGISKFSRGIRNVSNQVGKATKVAKVVENVVGFGLRAAEVGAVALGQPEFIPLLEGGIALNNKAKRITNSIEKANKSANKINEGSRNAVNALREGNIKTLVTSTRDIVDGTKDLSKNPFKNKIL